MENQNTGLFDVKLPTGKVLREAQKKLLEGPTKPKEKRKRILRGKLNLSKVYGPGVYADVGEQIEKAGLLKPTMAEIASKLNSKKINKIRGIKEDKYLWAFTGILYVPNKGVYLQDNPKTKKDKFPYMKESELENKLRKNDPSVRFVPFGYNVGYMDSKELGKNKFVIGLAGEEGAEKLAEVARQYPNHPNLRGLNFVNKLTTRVSAIGHYRESWGVGLGLNIDVSCFGYGLGGYSWGIQKNISGGKRYIKN